MAKIVAFEGKPSSGKTTLSELVERELNSAGISTLEAKRYSSENGMLSGMLRKFTQQDIVSRRDTVRSVLYHMLNYAEAMVAAKRYSEDFEVILMQRVPWSYLNIIDAMRGGSGAPEFDAAGGLYFITERWARLAKPDLIVYLTAPQAVLEERFAERTDAGVRLGSDRVHRLLISRDDKPYIAFLREYVDGNVQVVDSTDRDVAACEIVEIIRKERLLTRAPVVAQGGKTASERS